MPKLGEKSLVVNGSPRSTTSEGKSKKASGHLGRIGRLGRFIEGPRPITDVVAFLRKYMVMPNELYIVVAAWIIAAWLSEVWDRFPHLAITSPLKRCGKTTLLKLLKWLTPNPCLTPNASAAAIYRLIESKDPKPTFLLDESQSINFEGSEAALVKRELFNSGIDRDAVVLRCQGNDHEVVELSLYSPKVLALIGDLDDTLADRCLPVRLRRKAESESAEEYRDRVVQVDGEKINKNIQEWVETNRATVTTTYDTLPRLKLINDRLAELLLPLQAVLKVMGADEAVTVIETFARTLDKELNDSNNATEDISLLRAIHDIFNDTNADFIPTKKIIVRLCKREEETWHEYGNTKKPITAHRIGHLLRAYGITSGHSHNKKERGYCRAAFEETWATYTPPSSHETSETSKVSQASGEVN